jgi:glutathione synthase/RimK-type ligase-like ATP-grasp enzyme
MVVYQSEPLPVQASSLTFFRGEPQRDPLDTKKRTRLVSFDALMITKKGPTPNVLNSMGVPTANQLYSLTNIKNKYSLLVIMLR